MYLPSWAEGPAPARTTSPRGAAARALMAAAILWAQAAGARGAATTADDGHAAPTMGAGAPSPQLSQPGGSTGPGAHPGAPPP